MVEVAVVLLEELLDALATKGDSVEGSVDLVEDDDDVGGGVDITGWYFGEVVLAEGEDLGRLPVVEHGEILLLQVGNGLAGLGDEDVEEDGLLCGNSRGRWLLGERSEG